MVNGSRIVGVTGGKKTGIYQVPSSQFKSFQKWLNESGGGYVDWSVTATPSALERYGPKIQQARFGEKGPSITTTQKVSEPIKFESKPPSPTREVSQGVIEKPKSFSQNIKDLGKRALKYNVFQRQVWPGAELRPIGQFFEEKAATPLRQFVSPQDVYITKDYTPTASIGGKTLGGAKTIPVRTTLREDIQQRAQSDYEKRISELPQGLTEKEFEKQSGIIEQDVSKEYSKQYEREFTKLKPISRVVGGYALGVTGLGLLSSIGKQPGEFASETISGFKIDPLGAGLSTAGGVAGGLTLSYFGGKGVSAAKQKIAEFKARPQVIKTQGLNLLVKKGEGGAQQFKTAYKFDIKAGKQTFQRAAGGEIITKGDIAAGRFKITTPKGEGVGTSVVLGSKKFKIGKVTFGKTISEGLNLGKKGKPTTTYSTGLFGSTKTGEILTPRGKIETFSTAGLIKGLKTATKLKGGKSILGSQDVVVSPFEVKDVGSLRAAGATKVIKAGKSTTGLTPSSLSKGLIKDVKATIPKPITTPTKISPIIGGTAGAIGVERGRGMDLPALKQVTSEKGGTLIEREPSRPLSSQVSIPKFKTSEIVGSAKAYSLISPQVSQTKSIQKVVQKPLNIQSQPPALVQLQKQPLIEIVKPIEILKPTTTPFEFSITPPLSPGGIMPLLPEDIGAPQRRRKKKTTRKQPGGYTPSVLGLYKGLTLPKAPKGRLTGLEIRPAIKRKKTKPSKRKSKKEKRGLFDFRLF